MWVQGHVWVDMGFQSTRLSRASTSASSICLSLPPFQSTRLSRASTAWDTLAPYPVHISIHKALASLDVAAASFWKMGMDFNPQGSREPRQLKVYHNHCHSLFQSTRLSRASTLIRQPAGAPLMISIHKALASLDVRQQLTVVRIISISIHKALASLDSKIIQTYSTSPLTFYALCSSLPSSTNSVHSPSPLSQPFPLFFRCESPRHFMSAWHSHLV